MRALRAHGIGRVGLSLRAGEGGGDGEGGALGEKRCNGRIYGMWGKKLDATYTYSYKNHIQTVLAPWGKTAPNRPWRFARALLEENPS
jgi:hypothetical protein